MNINETLVNKHSTVLKLDADQTTGRQLLDALEVKVQELNLMLI